MYIRNIVDSFRYPYNSTSYPLYYQELNIYKKMLFPFHKKNVHFDAESKDKNGSGDESDCDESSDETTNVKDNKDNNNANTTDNTDNSIVNTCKSFYSTVIFIGKYSFNLLKNYIKYNKFFFLVGFSFTATGILIFNFYNK